MEDGNFWHLGGVTRWNSQFLKYTWTFLAIICVASQLFLCFFWIHLWVKNRCLQHPCFKNLCKIAQASKNSDSNAQHFLSDLLTHSWFHSMLFALLRAGLHYGGEVHRSWKKGRFSIVIGWKCNSWPVGVYTRWRKQWWWTFLMDDKMTWPPTWRHFLELGFSGGGVSCPASRGRRSPTP